MPDGARLRVYVDADVLLASAASPAEHSAGQVVLTLAEITLIDAITSELAVEESERNLRRKLPDALSTFRVLLQRAVRVVSSPSAQAVRAGAGQAHWKDLPHLVCAREHRCAYLITYNTTDYEPGHPAVQVVPPGALVRRVRDRLTALR